MPDLPILDDAGKLHVFAPLLVKAISIYPEDRGKQEELIASNYIGLLLKSSDSQRLISEAARDIPWLVPALYRSPTPADLYETAGRDGALSWAAGEIILTLLTAAIHYPDLRINITKAIDGLSRYYSGTPTYTGGEAKASKRTLWGSWRRFRTVAHLSAVQQLWIHDHYDSPLEFEHWSMAMDNLEEYLTISEGIRREAVLRRFVPEEITWRVPPGFKFGQYELDLGDFSPELLAILRAYRPEHSSEL